MALEAGGNKTDEARMFLHGLESGEDGKEKGNQPNPSQLVLPYSWPVPPMLFPRYL
jgi:hypothetical protein